MAVDLHPEAFVTQDEVLQYLQDQGDFSDEFGMLTRHINAVTAFMLTFTSRKRLHWKSEDLTEYRDGNGKYEMYTREAPIKTITQVVIYPHDDSPTTYTGPAGAALYNDDMMFDQDRGLIVFKRRTFPQGRLTVQIDYRPGFYAQDEPSASDPADANFEALRMIALETILRKWQRWTKKRVGISSEQVGETTVSYTQEDFTKTTLADLKRHRRAVLV